MIAACVQVKKLEEEGDFVYHEWLGRLFDAVGSAAGLWLLVAALAWIAGHVATRRG